MSALRPKNNVELLPNGDKGPDTLYAHTSQTSIPWNKTVLERF